MDDVAHVDLSDAGDAIDRRGQPRVAELDVGSFDQRLVRFDRALQLRNLCRLSLDQLRRCPAFLTELAVTIKIGLGILELSRVTIARGGHLVELRLIGSRVDLRKQVAGVDGLPFAEGNLGDLPLDLAAHDDGVVGDHGADAAQINRYIMLSDRSGDDRHACWCRRSRRCFSLRRLRQRENPPDRRDGNEQRAGNHDLASHVHLPGSVRVSSQWSCRLQLSSRACRMLQTAWMDW